MDVQLTGFEAPRHLDLLAAWLHRPHVQPWWGDPGEALAHAVAQPAAMHRIITADGHPCGYVCWQPLSPGDIAQARIESLPAGHMDIDILIGDDDYLGRGIGPMALRLVVQVLMAQGASSAGLGTAVGNAWACRAFRKAGFHPEPAPRGGGAGLVYFTRALRTTA